MLEFVRQQLLDGELPPSVGAPLRDDALDVADDLRREQGLPAVFPVEGGDRHTPGPLPGDAPVAAPNDHGPHPVRIALGDELDLVHCLQHAVPEAVDARKPLRGGARDDRLLAPPVVRVLVLVRPLQEEGAAGPQQLGDPRVCVRQHVGADERLHADALGEAPLVVDGRGHLETVLLPDVEVVRAVARRSVHKPCPGLRGDVVATEDHRSRVAAEWVLVS
mmetsp:Transcript_109561/g.327519  ORF Transcript_109561/g.327519 Transcript_109561/m.327519 type:complete len:220 (-) Transcript_109561:1095-1754(-)